MDAEGEEGDASPSAGARESAMLRLRGGMKGWDSLRVREVRVVYLGLCNAMDLVMEMKG